MKRFMKKARSSEGEISDASTATGGGKARRKISSSGTSEQDDSSSSRRRKKSLFKRKKHKGSDDGGTTGQSSATSGNEDEGEDSRKKSQSKQEMNELHKAARKLEAKGGDGTTTDAESTSAASDAGTTDPEMSDDAGGDGDGRAKKNKSDKSGGAGDMDDALRRAVHNIDERKKQLLSVRLHIIEAKELEGNNLHPVCKVTIDNKTHSTFIKAATNNPKWDQSLSFNMKCSIEELADMKIAFKVYSAHKTRSNSLIGCHLCDLGMIYKLPNHCLVNRWLVLTLDEFDADLTGYLKVWVCVVLPGILPPTYAPGKPSEDTADKALWPSSITFRPVQVLVRVFSLENLAVPKRTNVKKMLEWIRKKGNKKLRECQDTDKVCPFVEVQVGSFKLRTDTQFLDSNPIYNQELRFQVKWPPVSRMINLQVFDRQTIGMTNIPLANVKLPLDAISRGGESGFLPTIGPCCVCLYGSYDDAKASVRKKTNRGLLEPTAFQGRIFIEIRSYEMEEKEPTDVYDVPLLETELASDYVINNQYTHVFFCSFITCSMIPKPYHKNLVYFQVSFGHAGDTWRIRGSKLRHVARTEARHPLRDEKSQYYYMPWNNQKPAVLLTHKIEHQPWRFESANFFSNLAEKVSNMISTARQLNGEFEPRMASEVMKIIETILDHLTSYMMVYPESIHKVTMTELDYRLIMYRQSQTDGLLKEVFALKDERIKAIEALEILDTVVWRLNDLAVDPQLLAYPDIFIWMVCGGKRVGFAQVSAKDVFFAPTAQCRGKYCGRNMSIVIRRADHVPKESANNVIAHIHVQMYLSLVTFYRNLEEFVDEGSIQYFTEVYENKLVHADKQIVKKRLPEVSDEFARVDFHKGGEEYKTNWKAAIKPPRGFKYANDWVIDNFLETWADEHRDYEKNYEEVYHLQSRNADGLWEKSTYVNQQSVEVGMPTQPEHEGWQWIDEKWRVDRSAMTDHDGWEYSISVDFSQSMNQEQHFHKYRRRLLVRAAGIKREAPVSKGQDRPVDTWMYGKSVQDPMRRTQTSAAAVKRRRWRRRMQLVEDKEMAEGQIQEEEDIDKFGELLEGLDGTMHKLFVFYPPVYAWQLRAYIYQARDLVPYGRNNLPDAQVRVTFTMRSLATKVIKENINPIYDRTLVFNTVYLTSSPSLLKRDPISLALEIWDESRTKSELMGQCFVAPQVRPEVDNAQIPEENAKLAWHTLMLNGQPRGQVLAAFELYQEDTKALVPQLPPVVASEKSYLLPCGIKPNYRAAYIELLCLGVRNLHRFQMSSVKAPFVEIYLGKTRKSTEPIRNAKEKPNFEHPFILMETDIPTDLYYMTPLTICLFDCRSFGRKPLVGTCMIRDFNRYSQQTACGFSNKPDLDMNVQPRQVVPTEMVRSIDDEYDITDFDWWVKFHAASGEVKSTKSYKASGLPMVKIYPGPLEEMEMHKNFTDFCDTLKFFKVKKGKKFAEVEEGQPVGELKANLHIYNDPSPLLRKQLEGQHEVDRKWLQTVECFIRVYVVDAKSLASQNSRGTADPYIEVKCGKQRVSGRNKFIAKSLDPTFGQVYEMIVQIPQDKDLVVKVRDKNAVTADDDIGETRIDLENRLLSKWRAVCGLPEQYCIAGPSKWRDIQTPRQILLYYTERFGLPRPIYVSDTVAQLGKLEFDLDVLEEKSADKEDQSSGDTKKKKRKVSKLLGPNQERLALYMLHYLQLVPEHVETRQLCSTQAPGLSQGTIRLWVDMYPTALGAIPPPVNIAVRDPDPLQLRLVIYSARHVARPNRSLGVQSTDVFFKAWIQGLESKAQTTDVHYSCLDGEAEFNWRMVFDFSYLFSEDSIVCKKRDKFWQVTRRKEKIHPELVVQVYDNNKFKRDRFLGQYTFNLLGFEPPESNYEKMDNVTPPHYNVVEVVSNKCLSCCACCCDRDMEQSTMYYVKTDKPKISMFKTERNRGWWPMIYQSPSGQRQVTAKLDMEYALVTKAEADEYPVGKGRCKPNEDPTLRKPDRGMDSWWVLSKAKGLMRWLCRKHKGTLCMCLIVTIIIILIIVLIVRWPEVIALFSGKK